MAITITGAKYAVTTLSAVGTSTATVANALFAEADFTATQRIVSLFSPTVDNITNGSFTTDTNWTKYTGVTISGGVVNCVGATTIISQTSPSFIAGKSYLVSINYTRTAGVNLRFGTGATDGQNIVGTVNMPSGSGTLTLAFTLAANATGFYVSADSYNFTGTLDNLSVKHTDFKGIAFARKWNSTSQLQLESEFFDPVTGLSATQVVGDQVLVSKNFTECVTTGLVVSGNVVTISDRLTIGTAEDPLSACIYDEYKTIVTNTIAIEQNNGVVHHAGGVYCTGHLQDWTNRQIYGSCDYIFANSGSAGEAFMCTNTAAHNFIFGGSRSGSPTIMWEPARQANTIHRAGSIVWMNVDSSLGILCPNNGAGPWFPGTESRMCFFDCNVICTATGIAFRTANGVLSGGSCKIIGTTSLSAFGSTVDAVNFNYGAGAGKLFIVSDIRPFGYNWQPSALYDQGGSANSATINFTNVISPLRTVIRWGAGIVTFNWYWKNNYTNLKIGSRVVIERSIDRVVAASGLAVSSSLALTILEQVQSGNWAATPPTTADYSAWANGVWKYGYKPLSGTFNRSTYSLGTAGTSNYVTFGGAQLQEVDPYITALEATALAYTSIETLDMLYDRAMAWKCSSDANAQYPTLGAQIATANGTILDLGAMNVIIDGSAASAFSITAGTLTIKSTQLGNGAKFKSFATTGTLTLQNGGTVGVSSYSTTAGTFVAISVAGLVAGSRIQVYNTTDSIEIDNLVVAGSSYSKYVWYTLDKAIRLRATKVSGVTAKAPYEAVGTLTVNGLALAATQTDCPIYASYGRDGSTVTGFVADYVNDEVDLTVSANFYIFELFAWWAYNLTTEQGIREFFGGLTAIDEANLVIEDGIVDMYLDNTTNSDIWALDNRRLRRRDGARPVKSPTSGGGGIDVEWRSPVLFVNDATIQQIKTSTDLIPSTITKLDALASSVEDVGDLVAAI